MIFPRLSDPPGGSQLPGVFGYLNAVLGQEDIEKARDLNPDTPASWFPRCIRGLIADQISKTFRLQWRECPLNLEMAGYQIYHRDDMADALAVAYSMHLRGEDPVNALRADYAVGKIHDFGLLEWGDLTSIKSADPDSIHGYPWKHLAGFHKDGDRLVEYKRYSSVGFLLVRGDRLVWEVETTRFLRIGTSPKWKARAEEFRRRGGSKGFLRGEFMWPDPDWVNPVSDEEEAAARKLPRGVQIGKPDDAT
jgi:hypothetical protein